MTIQQMKYALTIAKEGSLSRAAEKLYVTQPSLTASLRDLEGELGIEIFRRSSRGVTVTGDGSEFLNDARQICQQYDLLEERYHRGKVRKKFGVSAQHYSFAVQAFIRTVQKYGTSEYEFSFRETQTRLVIRDVAESYSEIGILYLCEHNRKILTNLFRKRDLRFCPLVTCRAAVYLAKSHPLAKEREIGWEQLAPYPCLSIEQGEEESSFFAEEILSDADYPRIIRTADRATNLNLMKGLNAYTLCSGIISEELNGNEFVAVPFREDREHRNAEMEIGCIVRRNTLQSDVGKTYLTQLKEVLGIPAEETQEQL